MKCKNCGSRKMKHGGADEDYEYYMCQDCGKTLCVPVAKTVKLDALVRLLHENAKDVELEAKNLQDKDLHNMHQKYDLARGLRTAANYLDGTQAT